MATYQVKVKYGEERFSTFLIRDISFDKLVQEIKKTCSPLAHLPASNISCTVSRRRRRYDQPNLSEDPSGFAFGEMLRSAKEVKDRDYKKIFLQGSEIDSPLPRKIRRTELETPIFSASVDNESPCLQPKHLSFTPAPGTHPAAATAPKHAEKSPLDCQ